MNERARCVPKGLGPPARGEAHTNNSRGELFHVRCGTLVYNTEISHFIVVH